MNYKIRVVDEVYSRSHNFIFFVIRIIFLLFVYQNSLRHAINSIFTLFPNFPKHHLFHQHHRHHHLLQVIMNNGHLLSDLIFNQILSAFSIMISLVRPVIALKSSNLQHILGTRHYRLQPPPSSSHQHHRQPDYKQRE